MNSAEEIFNNLTDEQKAQAMNFSSPEEMFEFAKEEGMELPDEQLEAIAGGRLWNKCGELGPDPNCQTVCS